MRCDACGSEADLRLTGELLGRHIRQACRNCVGPGIGWFYMRRPGDWDDDDPREDLPPATDCESPFDNPSDRDPLREFS